MKTSAPVHLIMRIPPPLLFVATFFAGVGLQRLEPLTVHSGNVVQVGHVVGIGLLACGVLLALSCVGMLLGARTTIIPFGTASNLVTRGPYRFTRNPMYVSLVLIHIGVAGVLVQVWPLLLLLLPVTLVNGIVIPFEETRLREVFGSAYEQYCARVRRWL